MHASDYENRIAELERQLTAERRQNAALTAAIAAKDAALEKAIESFPAQEFLEDCDSEFLTYIRLNRNRLRAALALTPSDALAPVRNALNYVWNFLNDDEEQCTCDNPKSLCVECDRWESARQQVSAALATLGGGNAKAQGAPTQGGDSTQD